MKAALIGLWIAALLITGLAMHHTWSDILEFRAKMIHTIQAGHNNAGKSIPSQPVSGD